MDVAEFWDLIERSAGASAHPYDRTDWLEAELRERPLDDVLDFHARLEEQDSRAMTWMMWAAAAQIRNGCSDDGFEDFRMWLIGLGRETFERVVHEPDRLAELAMVQRLAGRDSRDWSVEEWPAWEMLAFVAVEEYENRLGEGANLYEAVKARINGQDALTDERWNHHDPVEVTRRMPRLAELFPITTDRSRVGAALNQILSADCHPGPDTDLSPRS
ncbi:DUF4240 domain-containing protein [Micromonospora echinaurantiaca]|uniref:DUF4240 domain-containing protein n=1 Tax=Micromonospora echinaurantiaca TaxID=47857 RepID=UPI00341C00AA